MTQFYWWGRHNFTEFDVYQIKDKAEKPVMCFSIGLFSKVERQSVAENKEFLKQNF